jgi:hypothetical protein
LVELKVFIRCEYQEIEIVEFLKLWGASGLKITYFNNQYHFEHEFPISIFSIIRSLTLINLMAYNDLLHFVRMAFEAVLSDKFKYEEHLYKVKYIKTYGWNSVCNQLVDSKLCDIKFLTNPDKIKYLLFTNEDINKAAYN